MASNTRRVIALLLSGIMPLLAQNPSDCTFTNDPDAYLQRAKRARDQVSDTVIQFAAAKSRTHAETAAASRLLDPKTVTRQNFIDDAIFGRMAQAGAKSAPLTTDAEFVRRIYLDLTSRLPSPDEVRRFLADTDRDGKRIRLIQDLLYSDAFVDKWTWWMDELVSNRQTSPSNAFRSINAAGRNALHKFFWSGITDGRPIRDMVEEMLAVKGNNYEDSTGAANFLIMSWVNSGPAEDSYDNMLVRSTSAFWGVSNYDCLLCHNGRGHLESISAWATRVTRMQAQQMSAFFARTNQIAYNTTDRANPYAGSYDLQDVTNRNYSIRTTFGNRPHRTPVGSLTSLTPEFTFSHGGKPSSSNWRQDFAKFFVNEPMFARNIANRIWKQMFNLGLVDPVDSLDPARLDPSKTPPDGWTLQATHPQLLEDLARWLVEHDFNLREFLRLIAESSAYQLSSEYPGEWKPEHVTLFARHYTRRLEAEEIQDALAKATGAMNSYPVARWGGPMSWAMQLPDTSEGAPATTLLNLFNRGNRETQPRQTNSTALQQLFLMNDNYVVSRIKVAGSPNLREIVKLTSSDAVADELYLTFLSRLPSASEKALVAAHIAKAPNANQRNAFIEDVAWALVNKIDFLFSY